MKPLDYENDMKIDDSSLDVEFLEHAPMVIRYAKHSAQMAKDAKLVKERLALVRADIDKEIRSDPEAFGIIKITEAAVQSTIIATKKYQTAIQESINAEYEADVAKDALRAMHDRRVALENLVQLHFAQYFAGPSIPRNLAEERKKFEERQDKSAQEKIAGGIKRTKKK